MRKIIYYGASSKRAVVLISLEERKKLKKEMIMELGKMLGEGVVKMFISLIILLCDIILHHMELLIMEKGDV